MRLLTHNCDLNLKYKAGWTEQQIAEADRKVAALNDLAESGDLAKTLPNRGSTSASTRYKNAGNSVPSGSDVDHIRDLQLGGADEVSNMSPLNSSVNRSLGKQIQLQLKDLTVGTRINSVTITNR
ncbi:MAG: HNH endonuclease [Pyrinomonadaceae bacterium]|nr:HNH endonuclease [Pyrinomonadaceae bacterium]